MDPEDCQSTRKGLLAPEEDATHVEIHVHAAASGRNHKRDDHFG